MATHKELLIPVALLAAAVLFGAAEGPLSYAKDVEPIVVAECTDCHGAKHPKASLDLSPGRGFGVLSGAKSQQVDMPLLKPGDPAGSYLWLKLAHTATQGKGMPKTMFGAKKLPDAELQLIQRWIVEGAKP